MKKKFLKKTIVVGITTLIITNMNYISASAKWSKDSKDNWSWADGKIKVSGWKKIDGKWYYFNEDKIMLTGWLKDNEKWYNLSGDGTMNTGWKKIDEKWYHFNEDGSMSIGWISDSGSWYFTNSSGEMETGTIGIDGQVYIFSDDGEMVNDKEPIEKEPIAPPVAIELGTISDKDDDKKDSDSRTGYVATNSDSLNIRLEASMSSSIIGTLAKGTEVKIIDDEKNGFYNISANATKGWVSSQWINIGKPIDEKPSTNVDNDSDEDINVKPINDDDDDDDGTLEEDANLNDELKIGEIRNTEPSLDDKHYYSDKNIFYKVRLSPPFSSGGKLIKGNCTWYAWGRAWEVTGSQPNDAGFIGNGYEWWEANKKSGKYQYGAEPRVGAIAVWKSNLPNSDGSGHVAVVEKIKSGKIYISESMWHGTTFRYGEIYETSYLYGYIYLDRPNY